MDQASAFGSLQFEFPISETSFETWATSLKLRTEEFGICEPNPYVHGHNPHCHDELLMMKRINEITGKEMHVERLQQELIVKD